MNILLPDLPFAEPNVEREFAGPGFTLKSIRWTPSSVAAIDDAGGPSFRPVLPEGGTTKNSRPFPA